MKAKIFPAACFLFPTVAFACGSGQYEKCVQVCLIPKLMGGCAKEIKSCSCLPKFSGDIGKIGERAKETAHSIEIDTANLGKGTVTTIQKAGGDTVKTLVKTSRDASATYIKAWKDTADQTKRSFQDSVDAGKAATNYTTNQLKSYKSSLSNAGKRLREGKVVDSMWGLAVEPLQASEANFAKATQESKLIATAAATAAAVYGGPGGAAAYAAWSTYRATGNADQALRAGLLAAASAQAGATVSAMPSGTMGEVLKKSAMAGAAGGIAVAAAGGDERAIKDGFLKSAGAVLVQAGSDKASAYSPKAKDAWVTVQCISARDIDCISKTTWARDAKGKILTDANGKPRIDTSKLDPRQYVGKWTGVDPNSVDGKSSAVVTKFSQLPKLEAIPLMKNRWVLSWTAGKTSTINYGEPTVVLTYVGRNPPFVSKVKYGAGDAVSARTQGGSVTKLPNLYACTLAGIDRVVHVSAHGNSCKAIYRREDGKEEIVWHSDHHPSVCAVEAARFVVRIRSMGIHCVAQ